MFKPSKLKDDFQKLEIIGNGSYGIVFLVRKTSNKKLYALKQVRLRNLNQAQKNQSLNQVKVLSSMKNGNIIKYQQSFMDEGETVLNIVMEYADGGDLQQKIQKMKQKGQQGLQEKQLVRISYGILNGLKFLHSQQIVHRDLKAANIFFVGQQPKIGDFNVSKSIHDQLCSTRIGTPYFIAPQVWLGKNYDEKCDVWAFGCLVYEMCCLKNPFQAQQVQALAIKVIRGKFGQVNPIYSKGIIKIIKRCLHVNPFKRASVDQLLMMDIFDELRKDKNNQIENNIIEKQEFKIRERKFTKLKQSNKQENNRNLLSYNRQVNQARKVSIQQKVDNKFRIVKKCQNNNSQREVLIQQNQKKYRTRSSFVKSIQKISINQLPITKLPPIKMSSRKRIRSINPYKQNAQ